MSDHSMSVVAGLERAMTHLAQRQKVIAGNIANADTPGFKSHDLTGPDFSGLLASVAERSDTGITRPTIAKPMIGIRTERTASFATNAAEVKADGNDVSLEAETLRMGDIQARYMLVASLYRKATQMMKIAIRPGG